MQLATLVCTKCLLRNVKQKKQLHSILPHFYSTELVTNVLSSIHDRAEPLLKTSEILTTHDLQVCIACLLIVLIVKVNTLLFHNN